MKAILIETEYIDLSQALKLVGLVGTGGEAKYFLQENTIKVNSALENRRGRKLYPGDILQINKEEYKITK